MHHYLFHLDVNAHSPSRMGFLVFNFFSKNGYVLHLIVTNEWKGEKETRFHRIKEIFSKKINKMGIN